MGPCLLTRARSLWRVRWKITYNFLPIAIATCCFALLIYKLQEKEAINKLGVSEFNTVSLGSMVIARDMDHLLRDIHFLYLSTDLAAISDVTFAPFKVEAVFIDFLKASETYSQARWIDEKGLERVRVDRTAKGVHAVPEDLLQSKAERYYFKEAMALPANGRYLSPVDLNVERAKVVIPYEPTMRVAMPIFDSKGERHGILILNKNVYGSLAHLQKAADERHITLIDGEGYWLRGEYPEDEWGKALGRPELRFALRHPGAWRLIKDQSQGQFEDAEGLWTFRRLELMADLLSEGPAQAKDLPVLIVISLVPKAELAELRRKTAIPSVALLIPVLVALLVLASSQSLASQARIEAQAIAKAKKKDLVRVNAHLKETLNELRLTQDELIRSEKLSALGVTVAGVAHEINTPLGAALVAVSKTHGAGKELEQRFAKGLRRSDLESYLKLQEEGLDLALRNLKRMAQLIKSFKQLASDRANEERREFILETVVKQGLILFENTAKRQNIEFSVNIASNLKMDSYPGSLGQVLHNLIDNAVIHAFDNRSRGCIEISAYTGQKPGFICIEIADNGRGMEEEVLKRIFDPFYTTRRERGGMGMGLHLCYHITTLVLGGSLNASSYPDKGTCFSLCLPMQAPVPGSDIHQGDKANAKDNCNGKEGRLVI